MILSGPSFLLNFGNLRCLKLLIFQISWTLVIWFILAQFQIIICFFIRDSTQIVSVRQKRKISKMEEELKCPVCLDFFKSPVRMTSCGHNYCQGCLIGIRPIPWLCPECRTEQQQGPEQLNRNFFLERSLENFIESRKKICVVHDLPKKLREYIKRFLSRFRRKN